MFVVTVLHCLTTAASSAMRGAAAQRWIVVSGLNHHNNVALFEQYDSFLYNLCNWGFLLTLTPSILHAALKRFGRR